MERDDDDDIQTPNTSRSNSISEEESEPKSEQDKSSLHEEANQNESTVPKNISTNVTDETDEIVAAKQTSFVSNSSSSESESENDFVAVDKNDVDPNDAEPIKINEPSITIETSEDLSSNENHEMQKTTQINESDTTSSSSDDNDSIEEEKKQEEQNVFENKLSPTPFEAFASDEPLHTPFTESMVEETERSPYVDESEMIQSSRGDDEPWELDESGDYKIKPVPTTELSPSERKLEISKTLKDEQKSSDESDEENYDNYFSKFEPKENVEIPVSKTVRFDDNLQNVAVLTPKDSLNESETSSKTDDSDEFRDEITSTPLQTGSDRITDYMNSLEPSYDDTSGVIRRQIFPPPDSHISLTESEDLPPSLPPLPPLNVKKTTSTENIPTKSILSSSSNTSLKRKTNSNSETKMVSTIQPTTDANLYSNTDTSVVRSFDSAILRSTSKNDSEIDPEEKNDVISCVIDNSQVTIDAKTISPFKCIVASAGQLNDENQTIIITLYGCWLPDRRLREYRYIMDQLFYYVYHKIEKLVTNDYVLVYFHGATPKHRTPEIKFLRKCYQMINFRLRKNLRALYVVHPTRWLRTVIAFSRPFFSNKFFHKIHYLYTTAELERQFPQNQISIPMIIEQTDWLYSQKYDRQNASIKRSIERSQSPLTSEINLDSADA